LINYLSPNFKSFQTIVMKYQQLGKSTLNISRIGFGCMSLDPLQQQSESILHRAIDLGVNYFDTADLYNKGANEELVGNALKHKRDQVVIASKVGNQWRKDGTGWDWNPRKEYILTSVEGSLKRLQTSYIDLYQMHGGTIDDPLDESIEAFEQLVKEGKIRYYGISSIRPNVIRYWAEHSNTVSVMMQYSLLDRRPEEECFALLHQKDIGVVTRGSVAQGLLVNKSSKPYLDYSESQVSEAASAVEALSTELRTRAQTAIQFILQQPPVVSAVIGIRTREQLEEAVATVEAPTLSKSEIESLKAVLPANTYKDHR
jgi:aryl-alcohol dehydrogenase-like predicted oxidoreductase